MFDMPTSKKQRKEYYLKYSYLEDEIIDKTQFIRDKHQKLLFKVKCPECLKDRGFLRKSQAFSPCMSCGQKGKISALKGAKRSQDFCNKLSIANERVKKRINPNWQKMSIDAKKIAHSVRSRLSQVIKNKNTKTLQLLGVSWQEFIQYLESKFQPGMTWENYGRRGWHIDHIRPLSSFDLSDPGQLKQACHYTNLQPLWWIDNIKKGDKLS